MLRSQAEADATPENTLDKAAFGAHARMVIGQLAIVGDAQVVEFDDIGWAGQGAHLLLGRTPGSVTADDEIARHGGSPSG